MKKILSLVLSALMLFSVVSVGVSAEEKEPLIITVANDLHYNYSKSAANFSGAYTGELNHGTGTGQLPLESELIIDEFLRRAGESEASVVLIPGDITDRGLMAEHEVMGAKFAEFEEQTGKELFIVPGNHDYLRNRGARLTADDIRSIYAANGYDQAIVKDTRTASYVAELNDEYRLLAIDSAYNDDVNYDQGLDKELYDWIEQQAKQAKADGKKMIAMSHFNLLRHMVIIDFINPGAVMEPSLNLPELFAQYNIKYSFVGHTHEQDIVSYTGSNGVTVYDAVTTSLNAYPCSYRVVSFGENVKFETRYVDSIDAAALKGKIPDASYQLACEDFSEYTHKLFLNGVASTVISYVSAAKVKSLLGLDAEKDAELCALLEEIMPKMNKAVQMPLYKEDETAEGFSVESVIGKYGLTISDSEYTTLMDFAIDVYLAHIKGDENINVLTKDFSMITGCFNAMMIYALEDVTADQYAMAMSAVCQLLGADIPVDFFKYAGSGVKKAEGIELLVTAVITPLLLEFIVDEGTPDNNVILEGYGAAATPEPDELDFFGKIKAFFKNLFEYILRIFGIK